MHGVLFDIRAEVAANWSAHYGGHVAAGQVAITAGCNQAFVAVMAEVRLLMEKMLRMSEVRLSQDEKLVYLEQGLCDTFKGLSGDMAKSAPTPKVAPRSADE